MSLSCLTDFFVLHKDRALTELAIILHLYGILKIIAVELTEPRIFVKSNPGLEDRLRTPTTIGDANFLLIMCELR